MKNSEFTDSSILVVAHPDDEVLWFSSILEHVQETIICFLDVDSRPDWSEGRRASLASFPLANVISLGLKESEAFNGANWLSPVCTDYGLKVTKNDHTMPGFSETRYLANYESLRQTLSARLKNCRNVFTHNPWGEYGHEEHVQVYRVVSELQREYGFRLWFSNYCSNKSHNLMLRSLSGFRSDYVTLETKPELARKVEELYRRNNCWTWPFDDYRWFTHDCFIEDKGLPGMESKSGHLFPLNYLKIETVWDQEKKETGWRRRVVKFVRRLLAASR
jgi:GlcNAc-PI de-N-acetylase